MRPHLIPYIVHSHQFIRWANFLTNTLHTSAYQVVFYHQLPADANRTSLLWYCFFGRHKNAVSTSPCFFSLKIPLLIRLLEHVWCHISHSQILWKNKIKQNPWRSSYYFVDLSLTEDLILWTNKHWPWFISNVKYLLKKQTTACTCLCDCNFCQMKPSFFLRIHPCYLNYNYFIGHSKQNHIEQNHTNCVTQTKFMALTRWESKAKKNQLNINWWVGGQVIKLK